MAVLCEHSNFILWTFKFSILIFFCTLYPMTVESDSSSPCGQRYMFNEQCVDKCPAETVTVGKTCRNVTHCTPDMPFLKDNGTKFLCVNNCGKGYVVKDTRCIKVTDCNRPIIDRGKCLNVCPQGYIYFTSILEEPFSEGGSMPYHNNGDEDRTTCKTIRAILVEYSWFLVLGYVYFVGFCLFLSPLEFRYMALIEKLQEFLASCRGRLSNDAIVEQNQETRL